MTVMIPVPTTWRSLGRLTTATTIPRTWSIYLPECATGAVYEDVVESMERLLGDRNWNIDDVAIVSREILGDHRVDAALVGLQAFAPEEEGGLDAWHDLECVTNPYMLGNWVNYFGAVEAGVYDYLTGYLNSGDRDSPLNNDAAQYSMARDALVRAKNSRTCRRARAGTSKKLRSPGRIILCPGNAYRYPSASSSAARSSVSGPSSSACSMPVAPARS
jgi:hypothetical protein